MSNQKAAEIEALNALDDQLKGQQKPDQPRDGVDPRIIQLAENSKVTLNDVSRALQEMGQAPGFFPVKDFPPQIIEAVVVHWQEIINHINNKEELPF